MLQIYMNATIFQMNAVLLNFLFIKESQKSTSFHKNIKQHNCFEQW